MLTPFILQVTRISAQARKSLAEVLAGPALALLDAAPQDLWPRLDSLCSRAVSSVHQVTPLKLTSSQKKFPLYL